jgi:hypothetical protein
VTAAVPVLTACSPTASAAPGGGPVVAAFERIGWTWGGRWSAPVDLHHFSETGTWSRRRPDRQDVRPPGT